MRSGQLARLSHVSTDTLRHYERLGLLPRPPRTLGNYRNYPPASEHRVALIQRALHIGFSLSELRSILALRDRGAAPCRQVRDLLRSKVRDADEQIATLVSFRLALRRLLKNWDRRLHRAPPGQAARLLEHPSPLWDALAPARAKLKNRKGNLP